MNDKAVIIADQGAPADQALQVFNPLDAPTEQFRKALIDRQENYDNLAEHLRGMLVPGHDFGQIHVAGKAKCPRPWECSVDSAPAHWSKHQLFAAGADKVLGMLGLAVQYPGEQDIMRAALTGKPIAEIIIKCQVVDHRGQVIAEELGACARDEVNGSLNTAVKRACKRARVAAVLRLPSISALFEADFLATVQTSADSNGGNTTSTRTHQVNTRYASGAELTEIPFGKHKGKRFSEVDDGWLMWAAKNYDDKPDIKKAAERALEARGRERIQSGQPEEKATPASNGAADGPDLPPVDAYEDDFDDEIPF